MQNALWNGMLINAEEIAQKESAETPVRLAGGSKELRCIDPNCENPIVIYKHGPKKIPHFCHRKESRCDYAEFDKSDNSEVRVARIELLKHFKSLGYEVECEKKLPNSRKYCHLLVQINGRNIVIQIARSSTSANEIRSLSQECEQCGYELRWIVLGDYYVCQKEKDNYHAMRFQFNHSTNRDLLVLDIDVKKISQTKIDESEYIYKGYNLRQRLGYDIHNLRVEKPISSLRIVDGELTLNGFRNAYDSWMNKKRTEFEKMKQDIDEQESRRMKTQVNQPLFFNTSIVYSKSKISSCESSDFLDAVTPEMISQFKVGTKVWHKTYGNGEIRSITLDPQTQKHNVIIDFEKGSQRTKVLEKLLNTKSIKII